MTEPTSPHDPEPHASGDSSPAPRFRLVGDPSADPNTPVSDPGAAAGHWAALSRKLLVQEDAWRERWAEPPAGITLARAHVPLIAAIARIRSDADAALALTGVLETLGSDAGVGLPCGVLDSTEFALAVPEGITLDQVAETIDDALRGQVRSTDLQGLLQDRSRARVEKL